MSDKGRVGGCRRYESGTESRVARLHRSALGGRVSNVCQIVPFATPAFNAWEKVTYCIVTTNGWLPEL